MFTRKEQAFFDDSYFKVIREEDQFIEVQSLNTGHCWSVVKNQFEPQNKVMLYHKHGPLDRYYHKHRQCRTISEAVRHIKEHDEYVLEQVALKSGESKTYPSRRLKIHESSGYKDKPTPTIILKGEWLSEWGFDSGKSVCVVREGSGELKITTIE